MNVEKVQLTVSSIKELLQNGYTWFKKDDLGYGSIQEKFQATDVQITTIRKHPALKDADTVARIFVIVDDTKNENAAKTEEPILDGPSNNSQREELPVVAESVGMEIATEESFDAFKNI